MSIDLVQSLNAYVNSTPQLVTVIGVMYFFIKSFKKELKEDINKLDVKIDNVRTELKEEIINVRTELKEDISRLDTKIDSVRAELGSRIDSISTTNTLIVGLFTKQNNELNKINN